MSEAISSNRLSDTSVATKFVYKVLEYEGPLSAEQLRKETRMSKTAVYNALNRLEEEDLVRERKDLRDPRTTIYAPRE